MSLINHYIPIIRALFTPKLLIAKGTYTGLAALLALAQGCSSSDTGNSQTDETQQVWRLASVQVVSSDASLESALYTISYDSDGLSIGEAVDNNGDGLVDEQFTYFYEEDRLTRSELDANLDGVVDAIRSFAYNGVGSLIRESVDDSADESINRLIDYSVNEFSNIVARLDNNNDGIVDSINTLLYDQNGRLNTIEHDLDLNGIAEIVDRLSYTNDGRVSELIRTDASDNQVTERWLFRYEVGLCVEASNHQPRRYVCIDR